MAENLPSDTELRAAYCIGVTKASEFMMDRTEKWLAETYPNEPERRTFINAKRQDAQRLRSFLIPRIYHLETLGIEIAMKQGEQDWAQLDEELNVCIDKCGPDPKTGVPCLQKCGQEMTITKKRVQVCNDLSWLPY